MKIQQIQKMIDRAVADEQQSGRLAAQVRQVAGQRGTTARQEHVDTVVRFCREYIEHVPLLMEQAARVGRQLGLGAEVNQLLSELEAYWFETNDLIPDHLGLIGLTDDAYATLLLLQSMSDYCSATFGRPLLAQNFTQANLAMRQFIGEPAVSVLDQRVGVTLSNAMMSRLLGQVVQRGFSLPAAPDPIWGNASINDIVTARLGAMGVV